MSKLYQYAIICTKCRYLRTGVFSEPKTDSQLAIYADEAYGCPGCHLNKIVEGGASNAIKN